MKNTKLLFCAVVVLGMTDWGYAGDKAQPQTEEATTSARLFTGPLSASGNDLWHSLILIPPLESAETITLGESPRDQLYLRTADGEYALLVG